MINLRCDLEWQLKVALERKSMETNDNNPLPPPGKHFGERGMVNCGKKT